LAELRGGELVTVRSAFFAGREGRLCSITFPGRSMPHDALLQRLHEQLKVEADAQSVVTLRTNVSVPRTAGARSYVQHQRWFTVVDPGTVLVARASACADDLASVPRVGARLDVA
jgi:hypothetical protein